MGSADNALEVLELVARHHPVGVSEVARLAGLPKSTAQRALLGLGAAGWIDRDATTEGWRPATRALLLAVALEGGGHTVRRVAAPVMQRLNEETEETIHLVVPDGPDVVLVERLPSPRAVTVQIPNGTRLPQHWCATGKAMLASLPPDQVRALVELARRPPARSERLDRAALEAELAQVRARGWAENRGEWSAEVRAVAAAIVDRGGRPVAAMSISCPPHRLDGDTWSAHGTRIRNAAAEVTRLLGG